MIATTRAGEIRQLAAALAGDAAALRQLAQTDLTGELARRHRLGAALAFAVGEQSIGGPALAAWQRQLHEISAFYLALDAALAEVAAVLAGAGIGWIPFKGIDVARRVYDHREARPTSDLDLLVNPQDYPEARRALTAAGWRGLHAGARRERYLAEEGYAWQATGPRGVLLELHFRLWGFVDEGFAEELVRAAVPDAGLPAGGRVYPLAHAYAVAAVHAWLTPSPRGLLPWWDLEQLARRAEPGFTDEVCQLAERFDLQLPVALAAEVAGDLWQGAAPRTITGRLGAQLRLPERRIAHSRHGHELADLPLGRLATARLVAGRRSWGRWRSPWRRLWAHPGLVEQATPDAWPWVRRRGWYLLAQLGLVGRGPRGAA